MPFVSRQILTLIFAPSFPHPPNSRTSSCTRLAGRFHPHATVKRVKFLLVFIDIFSEWIEAFPTTNKQKEPLLWLALFLLKSSPGLEYLPRIPTPRPSPHRPTSDNGPEFTSQITQNTAWVLQVPWRFHIPYHLQSSSKVERANRVLKETLTKLTSELHQDWTKLLPLTLLKVRALPKK